jgi:hypothetical protein
MKKKIIKKLINIKCIKRQHCLCSAHREIKKAEIKRKRKKTLYPFGFEYKKN